METVTSLPDQQTPDLAVLNRLVSSRRTNLRIDRDRPVDPETITHLVRLATWAPNHRLTEPWRFAVVQGKARATLGTLTAAYQFECGMTDEAKLEKTRGKYLRAPVVLLVASASASNATAITRQEDRDAVASGVQNILLAATAVGLASYWGTGAVCDAPSVRDFGGFDESDPIVAAIYLGWPIGDVPVPSRNEAIVKWID